MTSFKFRSCSPEGGVCTIHDVVMESIRGEPSSLIVRHADGSCEEQEGHRVLGYRHQLQDGYDVSDSCEYSINDWTYTVVRTFHGLWHGRSIKATWSIVEGQPQWVLSDPMREETLLTMRGHLYSPPPECSVESLMQCILYVLEYGIPEWAYPPCSEPQNPYQECVINLRNALIDRGACFFWMSHEGDYGFELTSVITALALPVFEPTYIYGQSMTFIEGAALEYDGEPHETFSRSHNRGEMGDWLQDLPSLIEECVMAKIYGATYAVLPMGVIIRRLVLHSSLPEAIRVKMTRCDVLLALAKHGHYDPATGHEPPVGQELDAIERKEPFRQITTEAFPGLESLFGDRHDEEDTHDA